MSGTRTQHRNNVPISRGEKHDTSLKILRQAGFETALQAATLTKLRALTIAPSPYLTRYYISQAYRPIRSVVD